MYGGWLGADCLMDRVGDSHRDSGGREVTFMCQKIM